MNSNRLNVTGLWLMMVVLAGTLMAGAPDVIAPRNFTDIRGRSMMATVVSIDLKSVVLKRESDKREFVFPIAELSEADQVFIAENRAALGKATTGVGITPLAMRTVTSTEVAKARRFAKEVLMEERTGGGGVVFHWKQRPKLTVKSTDAGLAAHGQKVYDEFCDAAGFVEPPAAGPEIVLCVGTAAEVEKLRQTLAPDANRGQAWTWCYRWDGRKQSYVSFVFFVPEDGQEEDNRRQVFRGIAAVFGCTGTSDEFPASAFHPKSELSELGAMDRQLVRLVYTQLDERAGRDKLLLTVEKNWAAMVAPPKPPSKP